MIDPDRRKFLKHLGLIGLGGIAGLAITHFSSRNSEDFVDEYSDARLKSLKKRVFATMTDFNDPNNRTDYEAYTKKYYLREGGELKFESGGVPYVNEVVCAYDVYIPEEDEHRIGTYCTHPCMDVCPVNALSLRSWNMDDSDDSTNKLFPGFKKKGNRDLDIGTDSKCIGCGKCFKICGYDAIQWINDPDGGEG